MEENVLNTEIEELKKNLNTAKGKLTTLEEKKNDLKKSTNDLIAKTIYQKKQDIERSYSEVLKEAEQRLKATEKEKEEEKKNNLKKEVEHNTRSAKENNVFLNNEIKRILKENKLPSFINSTFYMSLWSPSNALEVFIGIIAAILAMTIPTILTFGTYKDALLKTFPNNILRYIIIAMIYLFFIFIFGLIWLIIDKWTKKKPDILKEIKEFRRNITDNKHLIKKIENDTHKNIDDTKFDYTKLDRDIEAGKLEVENYRKKMKDALDNFVNVTEDEIAKNIEQESSKTMAILDNDIETTKKEISELQTKYDELKLRIAES
ncbi:MAG: ABC transporter permease [Lachnospiraceae bacterium]|nr:ABC transporter permease [Lachnospiraceae bacterium]